MSLADDVVIALAEVRAIGETLDNEHPMRQATDLAYQADRLVKDHEKAMAEQGEGKEGETK